MTDEIKPLGISPWNVAVGAWMGELRRRRLASIEQMAPAFGESISSSYLRTIEAGQNALPASAVAGLVAGYDLNFANAAMLTASVRVLDQRPEGGRNFDVAKIGQASAMMRTLWPASGSMMDWLDSQLNAAPQSGIEPARLFRQNAKAAFDRMEALLRESSRASESSVDDVLGSFGLNPFFEDTVSEFLRRLAVMPPEMNQAQIKQWERETHHRWNAVWGVTSEPDSVIGDFKNYNWSFLTGELRPVMRLFVQGSEQEANLLRAQFLEELGKEYLRSSSNRTPNVEVYSWGDQSSTIKNLLRFDHATRSVAPPPIGPGQEEPTSYSDFNNAWIYEVRHADPSNPGTRRLGFLDSFSLRRPNFYCATLKAEDLEIWLTALKRIYA